MGKKKTALCSLFSEHDSRHDCDDVARTFVLFGGGLLWGPRGLSPNSCCIRESSCRLKTHTGSMGQPWLLARGPREKVAV